MSLFLKGAGCTFKDCQKEKLLNCTGGNKMTPVEYDMLRNLAVQDSFL